MLVGKVYEGVSPREEFALMRVMGEPGGEVFEARARDGRFVVLRFWRTEVELDARLVIDRVNQASRVRQPMIAAVHGVQQFADGTLCLVSEYVPGRTLDAWVSAHGLPQLPIAVDFVRRLALALSAAHQRGMSHHALYPGNVVVVEPDTKPSGRIIAKLVDLGVPRMIRPAPRFEAAHFMAPEALVAELQHDVRPLAADASMNVYSCGCLLHYLCTGQPPFQSDSLENLSALLASGVRATPRRINPDVPDSLERVIVHALEREPKRRTASAADLAASLSYVESMWRHSGVRRKMPPPPPAAKIEPPPSPVPEFDLVVSAARPSVPAESVGRSPLFAEAPSSAPEASIDFGRVSGDWAPARAVSPSPFERNAAAPAPDSSTEPEGRVAVVPPRGDGRPSMFGGPAEGAPRRRTTTVPPPPPPPSIAGRRNAIPGAAPRSAGRPSSFGMPGVHRPSAPAAADRQHDSAVAGRRETRSSIPAARKIGVFPFDRPSDVASPVAVAGSAAATRVGRNVTRETVVGRRIRPPENIQPATVNADVSAVAGQAPNESAELRARTSAEPAPVPAGAFRSVVGGSDVEPAAVTPPPARTLERASDESSIVDEEWSPDELRDAEIAAVSSESSNAVQAPNPDGRLNVEIAAARDSANVVEARSAPVADSTRELGARHTETQWPRVVVTPAPHKSVAVAAESVAAPSRAPGVASQPVTPSVSDVSPASDPLAAGAAARVELRELGNRRTGTQWPRVVITPAASDSASAADERVNEPVVRAGQNTPLEPVSSDVSFAQPPEAETRDARDSTAKNDDELRPSFAAEVISDKAALTDSRRAIKAKVMRRVKAAVAAPSFKPESRAETPASPAEAPPSATTSVALAAMQQPAAPVERTRKPLSWPLRMLSLRRREVRSAAESDATQPAPESHRPTNEPVARAVSERVEQEATGPAAQPLETHAPARSGAVEATSAPEQLESLKTDAPAQSSELESASATFATEQLEPALGADATWSGFADEQTAAHEPASAANEETVALDPSETNEASARVAEVVVAASETRESASHDSTLEVSATATEVTSHEMLDVLDLAPAAEAVSAEAGAHASRTYEPTLAASAFTLLDEMTEIAELNAAAEAMSTQTETHESATAKSIVASSAAASTFTLLDEMTEIADLTEAAKAMFADPAAHESLTSEPSVALDVTASTVASSHETQDPEWAAVAQAAVAENLTFETRIDESTVALPATANAVTSHETTEHAELPAAAETVSSEIGTHESLTSEPSVALAVTASTVASSHETQVPECAAVAEAAVAENVTHETRIDESTTVTLTATANAVTSHETTELAEPAAAAEAVSPEIGTLESLTSEPNVALGATASIAASSHETQVPECAAVAEDAVAENVTLGTRIDESTTVTLTATANAVTSHETTELAEPAAAAETVSPESGTHESLTSEPSVAISAIANTVASSHETEIPELTVFASEAVVAENGTLETRGLELNVALDAPEILAPASSEDAAMAAHSTLEVTTRPADETSSMGASRDAETVAPVHVADTLSSVATDSFADAVVTTVAHTQSAPIADAHTATESHADVAADVATERFAGAASDSQQPGRSIVSDRSPEAQGPDAARAGARSQRASKLTDRSNRAWPHRSTNTISRAPAAVPPVPKTVVAAVRRAVAAKSGSEATRGVTPPIPQATPTPAVTNETTDASLVAQAPHVAPAVSAPVVTNESTDASLVVSTPHVAPRVATPPVTNRRAEASIAPPTSRVAPRTPTLRGIRETNRESLAALRPRATRTAIPERSLVDERTSEPSVSMTPPAAAGASPTTETPNERAASIRSSFATLPVLPASSWRELEIPNWLDPSEALTPIAFPDRIDESTHALATTRLEATELTHPPVRAARKQDAEDAAVMLLGVMERNSPALLEMRGWTSAVNPREDVVASPTPTRRERTAKYWPWFAATGAAAIVCASVLGVSRKPGSQRPAPQLQTSAATASDVVRAEGQVFPVTSEWQPALEPVVDPNPPQVAMLEQPPRLQPPRTAPELAAPAERKLIPKAQSSELRARRERSAKFHAIVEPLIAETKAAPQATPEPVRATPTVISLTDTRWATPSVVSAGGPPNSRVAQAPIAPVVEAPQLPAALRTEALEVRGSLSDLTVRRAVDRIRPQLTECFTQHPSASANVSTAHVQVTIDENGRARGPQVDGADSPALDQCLEQAAKKLVSGAPDTGTVKVSWNLRYGR